MTAKRDLLDRLPEFPLETFESIGALELSDQGPFLTIKPERVEVGPPPPAVASAPTNTSYTTRYYFAFVTYPKVFCHNPEPFVDGLQVATETPQDSGRDHPPEDLVVLAGRVQHYRLSSLQGLKITNPLWCTVRSGPWTGTFVETESCIQGEANRWEFSVVGMPELAAVWYGEAADMPAVPSLDVIWGTLNLVKQDPYTCCSGYSWCSTTQSCLPLGVTCQEAIPM